jgi:hypothetical protein
VGHGLWTVDLYAQKFQPNKTSATTANHIQPSRKRMNQQRDNQLPSSLGCRKTIGRDSDEAESPASGGRGHQLPPRSHPPWQGNFTSIAPSLILTRSSFWLPPPLTCPPWFSPQSSPSSLAHGRLSFSHTSLQTTPDHLRHRAGLFVTVFSSFFFFCKIIATACSKCKSERSLYAFNDAHVQRSNNFWISTERAIKCVLWPPTQKYQFPWGKFSNIGTLCTELSEFSYDLTQSYQTPVQSNTRKGQNYLSTPKYSINSHIQTEPWVEFEEINACAVKDSH